jgi:glycosyltransferase involved in cell wall biosynthesis
MDTHHAPTPRLSIVVPAYNEEATLRRVADKLLSVPYLYEIIIVDDCSGDGTKQIAEALAAQNPSVITVIRHKKNAGKTAALKTGFAATTGDIVMVQDADLEYDPAEIEYVIGPIAKGVADVVFGSRFQVRRAARVLYYYHYLANRLLTFFSDALTNLNLTDVETGYKAFRGEIIRNMVITSKGFGFEIEVTAKVAKLKCAVYEVPISYYGRTYEEGKKIGARDGLAAFWYLVKYNLLTSLARSYVRIPSLQSLPEHGPTEARAYTAQNLS